MTEEQGNMHGPCQIPRARFVDNPLALRATVQGQLPNHQHGSYDMQSSLTPQMGRYTGT